MGNIFFRRKRIVEEELDEIQKRSKVLEEQIQHVLSSKHSAQLFSSLSMILLVCVSVAFSLVNITDKSLRVVYSFISVLAGALVFYCINWITNMYFNWSITRKRNAQEAMSKKKQELLEKVKETETFKVAKEILDKYGDVIATCDMPVTLVSASATPRGASTRADSPALRSAAVAESFTSACDESLSTERADTKERTEPPQLAMTPVFPRPVPLLKPPRPFLGAQRSITDKVVDFLLGDGPNHRFALICSHCYTHNGMAKEEEFDYFAYRCWHCGMFNAARRHRHGATLNSRAQSERTLISAPLLNRTQSESNALNTSGVAPADNACPQPLEKSSSRIRSGSFQESPSSNDLEDTPNS